MVNFGKLLLIPLAGLFLSPPVFANLYRIDLTYSADDDGEPGALSGFFTINTALDTSNERFTSLGVVAVPNWITSISLTFDPDATPGNGNEVTTTSFDRIVWNLSNNGSFDVSADFMDLNGDGNTSDAQFSRFGFWRFEDPAYFVGTTEPLEQQTGGSEFPLQSTATTPGGLPILGLGALAYYYKKIKSKNYKL